MGHTTPALIFSLGRMIGVFVPLAWILAHLFGQIGVLIAMALSNGLVAVGALRYMDSFLKSTGA